MEHTPAPWAVQRDGLGVYYVNPAIESGEYEGDDPRHDSVVARCVGDSPMSGISRAEAEANAYLIAKAPELRAALEDVEEGLRQIVLSDQDDIRDAWQRIEWLADKARALLATLPSPARAPGNGQSKSNTRGN